MIDEKHLENVEYLNYLGSRITNGARCARGITSRIAMAKAVFDKKRILCHQQTGLKFKEEISKTVFGAELCMVLKFEDASESRSEISWKLKSGAGEGWRRSVGLIT
jgi:hypothetical protein